MRAQCGCSTRPTSAGASGCCRRPPVDQARLLLSPLYYIRRALEPFADLVEPSSPDLTEAIPQLLEQKPAVIVMGDVGTVPESMRTAADRLDGKRRHAGALRQLAPAERRQ